MGGVCSAAVKDADDGGFELKVKKRLNSVRSFGMTTKKGKLLLLSGDPHFRFSASADTTPRKSADARRSSFFGKGKAGLERAVEVLDAVGSGVANFNSSGGGFMSGLTMRGYKISILAFEVANTITRGANLMHSLSPQHVRHLHQNVFSSEGVQRLLSTDTNVLLAIAAADKREELDAFRSEVARLGDLCKDPQWHNLDRFFAKLDTENAASSPSKQVADRKMYELTILAQHTAELYHEMNAFDRFHKEYQQKREEAESLNPPSKGEGLIILQTELRHQKKLVMSLKRKSLWSKRMEEVIEKLVDIVAFIHQKIFQVFGNIADPGEADKECSEIPERLGAAGLALHYANLTNQISNIACRPSCLPPNTRDALYRGLPANVKSALHSSLRRSDSKQQLSVLQLKAEMEEILEWLVPMAASTSKMYQGFGWVGEWANTTSNDFGKQSATSAGNHLIRLQTLYHADKQKTDFYILELVKLLHHLISAAKQRDYELARSLPVRAASLRLAKKRKCPSPSSGGRKVELSQQERDLLERMSYQQSSLPILASKSLEFPSIHRRSFRSTRETQLLHNGCDLEVVSRLDLAF